MALGGQALIIRPMKGLHLLAARAAMSAWLICVAAQADAQQRRLPDGPRRPAPWPRDRVRDVIIVEREVVETVVVEPEGQAVPPEAPAEPPPEPRKPYAIGSTYSSIPSGCMKLIQDGAIYYHCNGEWYRPVGSEYLAVRMP